MQIIGTAGHVDHGKTLLIKALTGIDTDRLPEEKKRGLTIDLGFAHFKDKDGIEIGIVDVPGHERFIRNMVAGAWGIDLALLVVAADDGWMFQTGNHLKVLTAMGITDLIAVITKTDAVEQKQVEQVIEDTQLRLLEYTGCEYSAISVSAVSGKNINKLKELISERLEKVKNDDEADKPVLHVDRSFSIKGTGLVVTGSLRGGAISRNDNLRLLPQGDIVRVRGIQSYDNDTETATPSCRAALNIIGSDASEVKRGCCLTTDASGFTAEKEFIIELGSGISDIRNHSEAEFAAGTAHSIGSIHFLKSPEGLPLRARISLTDAIPLRHGQPMVIIRKGGSLITGSGHIIWKGKTTREQRIKIAAATQSDSQSMTLLLNGWAQKGTTWLFDDEKLKQLRNDINKYANSVGGVTKKELSNLLGMPPEPLNQLLAEMTSSGIISGTDHISGSNSEKKSLSKASAFVLREAERCGKDGLDTGKNKIPGAHKELRTLTRAGLIVPLTEALFITEKVFTEICALILKGLQTGDTFDIAHAKERSGLSRKYIIPILNKMEERKLVEREENLRRVL